VPRPTREALALGERYRIGIDRTPPRGPAGEHVGRGTGSSLEFQDRRAYSAGDDVRHVDWRALARTDQLLVRLWRDEVLPRVEILVDVSRSMAIEERKAQATVDLVALLARAAHESGAHPRVVLLGESPRVVAADELERAGFELDGRVALDAALRAAGDLVRPGSIVVLVSDFLFPHEAADLVRPLGARAGALAVLQVLARAESDPRAGGAHRFVDCESGEALDLVLDEPTVARYRERLKRRGDALETETRRARGRFASVDAGTALEVVCREGLAREGILEPR
jgi:uncharacterized protein (DUF58 family)